MPRSPIALLIATPLLVGGDALAEEQRTQLSLGGPAPSSAPKLTPLPPAPAGVPSPATLLGVITPENTTLKVFADYEQHRVFSPTALTIAEDNRIFIAETHRLRRELTDSRDNRYWIMDDLASQSLEDRRKLHEKWQAEASLDQLTEKSELIRVLSDSDGDEHADATQIYARGFDNVLDGSAAGILALEGTVYYSCLPTLWALRDSDGDGEAEDHFELQTGFGTRVSLPSHGLNGLTLGPDGRIYGTVGDRSLNLTTEEGTNYQFLNQGAAFRFDLDGSNFEVFHTGLRNPKEIAFNHLGDAFTVDSHADMGDQARVVYLVDGADSGWRTDHQVLHTFHKEIGLEQRPPNPWMSERIWETANEEQPAWVLPPIANLAINPAGIAHQPGTALGGQYADRFFICNNDGSPLNSGIHTFGLEQVGSSYQFFEEEKFLWGNASTDIDFGFNGTAYITDFVTGQESQPQGRVLALSSNTPHPLAEEVTKLVKEGFHDREPAELAKLLEHPDQRVRLRAQLALSVKPRAVAHFFSQLHLRDELLDLPPENLLLPPLDFDDNLRSDNTPAARLHATWGLAMLARKDHNPFAIAALIGLLKGGGPELRAQAAKALGEVPLKDPAPLIAALRDSSDRVRFFAAIALGRHHSAEAFQPLLTLAISAEDRQDPYLRHAAVVGLAGCVNPNELQSLAGHALPEMRLPALLALRHIGHTGVNRFLFDHTPFIRYNAIRAIHDTPIEGARPLLPSVIDELLENKVENVPPMIWRRLIHSSFRLATPANAERLLRIAKSENVTLAERKEALRLLQQWRQPHPVEQSLGRHSPQNPRPLDDVRPLLQSALAPLLKKGHPLQAEAIALASHYQTAPSNLSPTQLLSLIQNDTLTPEGRSLMLRELAKAPNALPSSQLVKILNDSLQPSDLRQTALELLVKLDPEASFPYLSQALQSYDMPYRQNAAKMLAKHPHPEVSLLLVAYLDALRETEAPDTTIALEMLAAAQASENPAVVQALAAYRTAKASDPLASHLDALWGGDPVRGEEIFHSHPASKCTLCHTSDHRITASGLPGPHLAGVGRKNRRYLLEALINPSAADGSQEPENISFTLHDGEIVTGIILAVKERELEVFSEGEVLSLGVNEFSASKKAPSANAMPAMGEILPSKDIRDLVAYLATLKKDP